MKKENIERIKDFAEDIPSVCLDSDNKECLTFKGCLIKYLGEEGQDGAISRNWNNDTLDYYARQIFNERLFKVVDMTKPIAEITQEDVDKYFKELKENPKYKWTENIDARCRQLFRDVYYAGVKHKEYDDQLFWNAIEDAKDTNENSTSRKKILLQVKSMTFREVLSVFNFFKTIDPKKEDGRIYGLMLMFYLGLRNNEAAGASFENIVQVLDQDFHCLFVLKTTVGDSNKVKAGGKTYNAARILPVFPFLLNLLQSRREAIVEKLMKEGLTEKEANNTVQTYPIACKGTDFNNRCTRNDITKKAREVFNKLNIKREEEEASITELTQRLKEYGVEEKNPTAYLCRRNVATQLYCLGLNESDIEYYLGHEIQDANKMRNYFTNPSSLEKLYNNLKRHPLVLMEQENNKTETIKVNPKTRICIRIVATEPGQKITIKSDLPINIIQSDAPKLDDTYYSKNIDISGTTATIYKKIEEENKAKTI